MNNSTLDTTTDNEVLGQNIKRLRKNLNLTQEQFAEQLGINCQFLSQVENGKAGISLDTAIKICKIAKCSSISLFDGIIESPKIFEKYELLNDRDKSVITQMLTYLLNTK